jgi:radical SAM protein with 4Fe4S-binding SPASM domain
LAALAEQPHLSRRVLLVDDRRARPVPLLGAPIPEPLRGRVEVLAGPGRGPAAARNTGWRYATAPWVAFLDDDVLPPADWSDDLVADLHAAERAGVAGVQGCVEVPLPKDRRPTDAERNVGRLHHARWITADFAIRREALERVGGFDERFPRPYREDSDHVLRLEDAGLRVTEGRRVCNHPPPSQPWWISLRQQAGNADDALMARLHGRDWQGAQPRRGRRRRHLAVTAAGLGAVGAAAAGRPRLAAVGFAGWAAGTAELAWARIAPGPRTAREVGAMVATSAVLPPLAVWHWARGVPRARRLAKQPGPAAGDSKPNPALPPLPHSLQVEVTACCNLRCEMCLVRYRPPVGRASGAMPLERFRRLLDDMPTLTDVTLQGLGEPLLAPDIVEMVRLVKARGATVGFNTNATVLTRERADELVEAGVDWLAVSLDGATPQTYEAIRHGARFATVVDNIAELVDAPRRVGRPSPAIKLVFVAMRRNVHDLPALVHLAHDLGVPTVAVQNLSHSFSDVAGEPGYQEIAAYSATEALWGDGDRARAAAAFAEAAEVARRLGVELHLPVVEVPVRLRTRHRPSESGCEWPSHAAYVNHDGTVQPCCMVMGSDRATMGNIDAEAGFAGVWWGPALARFREALRSDIPPAVCRGCSLYRGVF